MAKSKELRDTLNSLRHSLQAIESIAELENIARGNLRDIDRDVLLGSAKMLLESLTLAQSLLQGKALADSPAFLKLPQKEREFWIHSIEPRMLLLKEVCWQIRDPLLAELLVGAHESSSGSYAVRKTFAFSLDHTEDDVEQWKNDEFFPEDHFDRYDFDGAREIVGWPVFLPDIWRQNVREMRAVLTSRQMPLPRSISKILSEVNRTFLFGQYLGCVAMARAAMEYAIVSRAEEGALRISTADSERSDRLAALDVLIRRVSEANPSVDTDSWNYIRRSGNDVMHDMLAQEKTSRIPETRQRALSCIKKLRTAIEDLYSI